MPAGGTEIGTLVGNCLFQRLALDIGRGDVVMLAVAAGVEDRHDVRMAKLGGRFRLAEETGLGLRTFQHGRPWDLQGHFSLEHRIVGPVDCSERPRRPAVPGSRNGRSSAAHQRQLPALRPFATQDLAQSCFGPLLAKQRGVCSVGK